MGSIISKAYKDGKDTVNLNIGNSIYEIDFKKMIQTTKKAKTEEAKIGYRRPIRFSNSILYSDGTTKIESIKL